MIAGEILAKVDGLTHDKLTYFVRAGYLQPKKVRRGSLDYNDFSDRDLQLVTRAWGYIQEFDMKTKSAFQRAEAELNDPQKPLF